MLDILRREAIYLWYYFGLQLEQIFGYWVLGMVLRDSAGLPGKFLGQMDSLFLDFFHLLRPRSR